ncbi:MAG TPA: alpha/beta fold hydrolase [Balneolales bacterium]|nr:alpha/beta fold hydrolase [Balneolales bacterium]
MTTNEGKKLWKRLRVKEFPQPNYIHIKYPILFCHGFGSLASLVKKSPMDEICMLYRSHGILSFAPNIVPYNTIKVRAEAWCHLIDELLEQTQADKINIIAHSMGGLDMRYAISEFNMSEKVSSLTTISTPHQGSSLAEWALSTPARVKVLLAELLNWVGNSMYPKIQSDVLSATSELTRDHVEEIFNRKIIDAGDVAYYSYSAAAGKGTKNSIGRILVPFNNHIYQEEGINDGFVSEQSGHWGKHLGKTNLSHIEQIKVNLAADRIPVWQKFWTGVALKLSSFGH